MPWLQSHLVLLGLIAEVGVQPNWSLSSLSGQKDVTLQLADI